MAAFLHSRTSNILGHEVSGLDELGSAVQRQLRKSAGGEGIFGLGDGKMAVIFVLGCILLTVCVFLCRPKFYRAIVKSFYDDVGDPNELKYMLMTSWTFRVRPRPGPPRSSVCAARPKLTHPPPSLSSDSLSWTEAPRLSQIRLALAARRPQFPTKPRVAGTAVSDAFAVYHHDGQVPPPAPPGVVTSENQIGRTSKPATENAPVEVLPHLLGQERGPASVRPKSHKKGRSYKTKVGVADDTVSK